MNCDDCRYSGDSVGRKVECRKFRKIVSGSAANVCQGFAKAERDGGEAFDADWQRKYRLENLRED